MKKPFVIVGSHAKQLFFLKVSQKFLDVDFDDLATGSELKADLRDNLRLHVSLLQEFKNS